MQTLLQRVARSLYSFYMTLEGSFTLNTSNKYYVTYDVTSDVCFAGVSIIFEAYFKAWKLKRLVGEES